jgi:hypothetical protein
VRLRVQDCERLLFAARDIRADHAVLRFADQGIPLRGVSPAPHALGSWAEAHSAVRAALDPLKLPGDAVVLVGEGTLQRGWSEAGKLAAFLPGESFFGATGGTSHTAAHRE